MKKHKSEEINKADRLYQDSSLVQFYDYDNPWSESYDIINNWIKSTDSILDLGCGTGTLATELARRCKNVYGLDISLEMLQLAKEKSATVKWIQDNASGFSLDVKFDFIILSSHSFQTLLNDDDRLSLLKNIKKHLQSGGTFVFDSRNPKTEEWKTWNPRDSVRYFKHPVYGVIKSWNDWETKNDLIRYHTFYQVIHTDNIWRADTIIAFPEKSQILSLIEKADLNLKKLYGDWQLNDFNETSEEMIFVGTN